ncbi:predicted protein [Postia placenta Mad-698-R]|uniref:Uncharacterized protein n=1 Tax=Postia placenta MAD-698-R-SB12 TaxID=670580 RepID=A0A1X6N048_9APHY|nr:hypothetical protein POSPLADRAFT_1143973 [Postia placenta MAD-698-R-SB12]EED79487.1 predicted protein [Postia placenta Mad-698-R]OSX61813.1 hypothetical protein POSPLADRAFT_1143973 [Postia placenta MAD-698-R-SB12]
MTENKDGLGQGFPAGRTNLRRIPATGRHRPRTLLRAMRRTWRNNAQKGLEPRTPRAHSDAFCPELPTRDRRSIGKLVGRRDSLLACAARPARRWDGIRTARGLRRDAAADRAWNGVHLGALAAAAGASSTELTRGFALTGAKLRRECDLRLMARVDPHYEQASRLLDASSWARWCVHDGVRAGEFQAGILLGVAYYIRDCGRRAKAEARIAEWTTLHAGAVRLFRGLEKLPAKPVELQYETHVHNQLSEMISCVANSVVRAQKTQWIHQRQMLQIWRIREGCSMGFSFEAISSKRKLGPETSNKGQDTASDWPAPLPSGVAVTEHRWLMTDS